MYVKLINPATHNTMIIPCDDEVYYELLDPKSQEEQDTWSQFQEGTLKNDPRRFVVWPRDTGGPGNRVACTEIILTGRKPIAILTNWNAWLCNDAGKTMERLHRHE